jgi:hypothetical protein
VEGSCVCVLRLWKSCQGRWEGLREGLTEAPELLPVAAAHKYVGSSLREWRLGSGGVSGGGVKMEYSQLRGNSGVAGSGRDGEAQTLGQEGGVW